MVGVTILQHVYVSLTFKSKYIMIYHTTYFNITVHVLVTCIYISFWNTGPCNSKIENCESPECVIEDSVICTRCANGSELIECRTTSAAG